MRSVFGQRGSFWSICGGFVRKVVVLLLDIGGASDGHVVLLTERRFCFGGDHLQ